MVMEAIVTTVDNKYRQLIDSICRIKNGLEVDYDKVFNLAESIHEDEMSLVINLFELEKNFYKPELKIPSFMAEKRA